MQKLCLGCQESFETTSGAKKYCSEKCRLDFLNQRVCLDCKATVPWRVTIDGKVYSLKNRHRCLDCHPFKTKRIKSDFELFDKLERNRAKTKRFYDKNKNVISVKKNSHGKKRKILALINNSCQFCGYSKCIANLSFHHVDEKTKHFSISVRELQFSMNRLIPEVKKCIVVCHNCHGEIHHNMISDEMIQSKHTKFVSLIESSDLI